MFKDYKKYLSTSLKVYLFVLLFTFILKIVGLDYFGLDIDNSILININSFLQRTNLIIVLNFITLYIMFYIYLSIICNKRNVKLISFFSTLFEVIIQLLLMKYNKNSDYRYIIDFAIMFIVPSIINKKILIKKPIIMILLMTFYQVISLFIRNINFPDNYNNSVIDFLLNIDQLLLLIITHKIYFLKGDVNLCQEVGLFSLKKLNLKKSLQNLQKSYQSNLKKFKSKSKEEKLTIIIYLILSLIWNTLSVVLILFVAFLNDTLVECIFILTSFWLSKRSFGKAFHLNSMLQCFIVSNLTYYTLNRITTPLGISIFVPVLLGVGLSYVTSKLVKKTYKPLYRGMPEELFEETITKLVDKESIKYKICREFYINNVSDLSLAFKYNYTVVGVRKMRVRLNAKIKELN